MAVRMQQRRATAEQWLLADPILEPGEIGYETDTNSFKIGDGINNWSLLDYFETSTALQGTIDDYIPLTQKGAALGVAELDANGFVPSSQLDIDLTAYYTSAEVDTEISTAVSGLVDSAPGVLDTLNELAAAIGDDANFVTTINTSITDGDAATLASAQSYADTAEADAKAYADGLAVNYDPAGSAATAESNANSYTDGRETAITTAYQTYADTAESDAVTTANSYTDGREAAITTAYQGYADQAEADAISAAASDATTKANAAETNAKGYADDLVGDATVDGTAGNTVTDRIATAVAGIVDTAPEALDTLNELAAALGDDPNFATTIATQIGGKADTVHTHTLSDVTDVTATATELNILDGVTASTTELNYVDGVTSSIQTQLDGKAASSHTHAISDVADLQASLDAKASLTETETLTNKTLANHNVTGQTKEDILTSGTGFAGYTYNVMDDGIQYITANSTANGTINFRGNGSTTMNTFMATNQSVTCALLVTNGATPYYPNAFQIDGSSITPKWQGATAPTSGNANSIDAYTFTILKTGSATYTLLASQTRFA